MEFDKELIKVYTIIYRENRSLFYRLKRTSKYTQIIGMVLSLAVVAFAATFGWLIGILAAIPAAIVMYFTYTVFDMAKHFFNAIEEIENA